MKLVISPMQELQIITLWLRNWGACSQSGQRERTQPDASLVQHVRRIQWPHEMMPQLDKWCEVQPQPAGHIYITELQLHGGPATWLRSFTFWNTLSLNQIKWQSFGVGLAPSAGQLSQREWVWFEMLREYITTKVLVFGQDSFGPNCGAEPH